MEPADQAAAARRPAWALYLTVGAVVIGAYLLLSRLGLPTQAPRLLLYNGLSCSAAVAILIGVRRLRPDPPAPWYLLAAAQLVYACAGTISSIAHGVLHQDRFPAAADVLYLCHYPILVAGLLLLVRQRIPRGDRASLIDASVITLGVGLLSWTFLVDPYIGAQLPALTKAASAAYPVADLLVFAVAVRLLLGPGRRPVSYQLLTAGLLLALVTDSAYALLQQGGGYTAGELLDATWLGSYLLLGAAALHPSMRMLAQTSDTTESQASRLRLLLLAGGSLLAPATLGIQALLGRTIDVAVIAPVSAALFLLVVARLDGLVAEQRRAAITDGLTRLYNRRFFEATLRLEVEQAGRSGQDLGLLVLDIDRFKRVNDTYGHQVGDQVLREVAARLSRTSRGGDVVARYGGEEFVVLLRDTSIGALPETAERLRRAIGDEPLILGDGTWVTLTASVGGAARPIHAHSAEELERAADQALYTAKRLGQNRIQIGPASGAAVVVEEHDEDAVVEYLECLADEIDARQASEEHSAAIGRWAGTIAEHLSLGPDVRRSCELAGRFHDIGKIVVPDEILLKPGPLTNREWAILRRHPVQGARLIGLASGLNHIALIVRQHHERFDGSGYPDHRAGEDIRIEARIVAVCDAWAAMRANRPYNEARSAEEAREQLRIWSGSQFDGKVVEAFLELEQTGAVGTFSPVSIRNSG